MTDSKLLDDEGRLAALRRYDVLDTPPEREFDKITRLVTQIFDAPMATVSLIDEDRQWFKSAVGLEYGDTPRETAFCNRTIQTREPLVVEDAAADPRFADNPAVLGPPNIRAYAGVPLASPEGYNLGALCVVDTKPRRFTPEQLDILRNFGALVIEELELRTTARRDFLTGAVSRRAFADAARRCFDRHAKAGTPCTFVTFDIDHFKKLNDGYGHPFGDEVLRTVAAAIREQLRPTDLLGRLGGEEFGVLLTETEEAQALPVAERLREAIAALRFKARPEVGVTASFGLAALASGHDQEAWFAAADAGLYEAKHGGRNRTVVRRL